MNLSPWKAAAALLCAALVSTLQLPLCRFAEEEITIDVWPDEVQVHGVYHYENPLPLPIRQGLVIPLPVDADHPEPYSLSVQSCPVWRVLGSYYCDIAVGARAATSLDLQYRQFAPHHNARYLLTTTRAWLLPLRRAVYRLVPHGVTIEHSNYAMRGETFLRTNFMPDRDWQFTWH